jgi:transcriptional regulator with GAF, ATPase, and Fis domain
LAESDRLQRLLEDENAYFREQADTALAFGRIVGNSPALRRLLPQVELVAATDATMLVLGESGSGKELFAREIHQRSRRAPRPLITVNCSAIPHEVFESECFGHVRGAFTGAVRDRPGRFQLASGGTIFLDEVGHIPFDLQPKLPPSTWVRLRQRYVTAPRLCAQSMAGLPSGSLDTSRSSFATQ